MRYQHRFRVRAPLAAVADFHSRADSMVAITPPFVPTQMEQTSSRLRACSSFQRSRIRRCRPKKVRRARRMRRSMAAPLQENAFE